MISGPVELDDPPGVTVIPVESARDMLQRVEAALPVDIAIFAAAVADWRVAHEGEQKLKKTGTGMPPLSARRKSGYSGDDLTPERRRPPLVIGFAAETEHLIENARAKLARKGCDWIVANDVSPATGVMGGDRNTVHLITADDVEDWPRIQGGGRRELIARIAADAGGRAVTGSELEVRIRACRTARACRCRPIRARTRPASICSPRCRKRRR